VSQLFFDFYDSKKIDNFKSEDFLKLPENLDACNFLDNFFTQNNYSNNAEKSCILRGESGCGKTHLLNIYAHKYHANFIREEQIKSENYAWHNENAQVDLVIDRDDNVINLCEVKFWNDEFTIDENYLQQLRKKENEFRAGTKTKKALHTVMLTTWGVKVNEYSTAILTQNIKADCLFEGGN
jgi:hypothetical protein